MFSKPQKLEKKSKSVFITFKDDTVMIFLCSFLMKFYKKGLKTLS